MCSIRYRSLRVSQLVIAKTSKIALPWRVQETRSNDIDSSSAGRERRTKRDGPKGATRLLDPAVNLGSIIDMGNSGLVVISNELMLNVNIPYSSRLNASLYIHNEFRRSVQLESCITSQDSG